MADYEGTKLQDITPLVDSDLLENSKVLIITDDNQYLVSMQTLVEYVKRKVGE